MEQHLPLAHAQARTKFFGGLVALCWLIFFWPVQAVAAEPLAVDIVISEPAPIYESFASTLTQQINKYADPAATVRVLRTDRDRASEIIGVSTGLIVSIGTQATAWAMEHAGQRPVFATLIPAQSFATLVADQ